MTYGTMEKIQTVTVPAGGQAAITFSNVPQTYDDLKIVISGRSSSTPAEGMYIAFNGSTSNFTGRYLIGDGANASSGVLARYVGSIFGAVGTASTFNNTEIYIPNYRTSANKSFSVDNVAENNATTAYGNLITGLWSDSSAITSISITCAGFLQHSTATLYGITRVPAGAKATGGVVYDDASYWYHVFTSSGTFTPSQNLSCDVLVVAGGGGGGSSSIASGGGGAGGLLDFTAQSLTATTNYTVTVGAGGSAGATGSDSQFGALTLVKGGGRGATDQAGGGAGSQGSGGGGAYATNATGGTATAGQGSNGGNGATTANYGAGGGGGGKTAAGANGTTGTGGKGGNGGDGSSSYSTWGLATNTGQNVSGTVWYAGGGGGGSYDWDTKNRPGGNGGNGGGGTGGYNWGTSPQTSVNAIAGIANTGGGGGGQGQAAAGVAAAGGSGVVIVRYAK